MLTGVAEINKLDVSGKVAMAHRGFRGVSGVFSGFSPLAGSHEGGAVKKPVAARTTAV